MDAEARFLAAFNAAIDDAGLSLRALGERVGRGKDTVSLWVRGRQAMKPDEVFAVEQALSLQPGELSQHLGYLPTGAGGASVARAIGADPDLGPRGRRTLRAMYEQLRGQA